MAQYPSWTTGETSIVTRTNIQQPFTAESTPQPAWQKAIVRKSNPGRRECHERGSARSPPAQAIAPQRINPCRRTSPGGEMQGWWR